MISLVTGCFPYRIKGADLSKKAWNSAICHQHIAICWNPGRDGVVGKGLDFFNRRSASGFDFRSGNGHSG